MAYKAIVNFKDLQTGHDYKAGESYPYTGNAEADRVKQLITPTSQRGPLIEEVAEEVIEKKPARSGKKKKEE